MNTYCENEASPLARVSKTLNQSSRFNSLRKIFNKRCEGDPEGSSANRNIKPLSKCTYLRKSNFEWSSHGHTEIGGFT